MSKIGDITRQHGEAGTHLYNIFKNMRSHLNAIQRGDLAGQPYEICDEWITFETFKDWSIKNGYEIGLRLVRTTKSDGFKPSNCSWKEKKKLSGASRRSGLP